MMKDPQTQIIEDLERLGVAKGDALLVHSSLNAIGRFENRARIVIDALRERIGESGTLLLPALSYENVTPERPEFNLKETPTCVGALTEYFRCLPDTLRSLHPTHSICASGKNAAGYLSRHHLDHTPCGPESPLRKLMENNGKILFLGCGLRPNTSMHGIEELSPPPYLFGEMVRYRLTDANGNVTEKEYITHDFRGYEQRYDRVAGLLDAGDYATGMILSASCWLLKSAPLWEKALKKLRDNPLYFVDRERGGSG